MSAFTGAVLLAAGLLFGAVPAVAQDVVSGADIEAVVEAFHAALERGDSTAVLGVLDPEVVIYEAGRAETFEQYRSGHLAADIEFAQSVESSVVDGWAMFDGRRAVVGRVYAARGTFRGREIDAITTETMVLTRTREDAWRIRHIHWSSRRATPPGSDQGAA